MRRGLVLANALAGLGLLVAGCGGNSPNVASVASTTTAATTTHDASMTAAPVNTPPAGSQGGNHTVLNVGDPTRGRRFSACMRAHGEPDFPDPDPQGLIQLGAASGIDPRAPRFRSALHACRTFLPAGFGQPPTATELAQAQHRLLVFSTCMRTHGIADFPDPSGGALPRTEPVGDLDPNNPRFEAAYGACKSHLPAGLPGKALGGLAPP
jgi:hypothetical protein